MASAQLTLVDGTGSGGAAKRPRDLSFEMQQMSARQIWFLLRRHIVLVSAIVGICTLAVLALELVLPNLYEGKATVQVELNDVTGTNQADAARNQQRVANEARIYRSQALAETVVKDLDLSRDPLFNNGAKMTPQQAAILLMTQTVVVNATDSDFVDITVRSRSAGLAAKIANQYVDSLQKLRSLRRQAWRDGLGKALGKESTRLASAVEVAERDVANFRRAHDMPIGAGSAEDYQQMNRIAVEAATAAALSSATAAQSAGIQSASRLRTVAGATTPVVDALQRQYDDLIRQKSELSVQLGANHPQLQAVQAQISQVGGDLQRQRASVINAQETRNNSDAGREQTIAAGEAQGAAARAGQLQSKLSAVTGAAFRNNANLVDLSILDRRAEVAKQAYLTTAQRAQTVQSELETTGVNSSMVSAAAVPLLPVSPTPLKMSVAAFAGSLILALLAVFAIEMFDNKLRSGEQLNRLFGLQTLAMLPMMENAIAMTTSDNPVVTEPQSLFAEVARNLASEIREFAHSGDTQSVLVTSPLPGDGKSSVALTLAAAAASMGRRAIVVDLDLRRPGPSILRSIQGSSGTPDLIEVLKQMGESQKLIPQNDPTKDAAPKALLPVVLSTTEYIRNPASLIEGWQVGQLLTDLRDRFDLIVINAPAILAVRDAHTLCNIADSTLMVVRWGSTTVEQMRAALQLVHNDVVGAVFNQVDYAEHARRGYGDAVQFYMGSASYYSDNFEPRRGWLSAFRSKFRSQAV
jgi:uncharacterized protein involved in exopolysaccharide biosynthesis/Mrp family chromosome partitioning ATPase